MKKIRNLILICLLGLVVTILLVNSGLLSGLGIGSQALPNTIDLSGDMRVTYSGRNPQDQWWVKANLQKFSDIIGHKKGLIEIYAYDASQAFALENRIYVIKNAATGEIVDKVLTNTEGYGQSMALDYHVAYSVSPLDQDHKYLAYTDPIVFLLDADRVNLTFEHQLNLYISDIEVDPLGEVVVNGLRVNVPVLLQYPELPNGCEITSAASLLQSYGFDADKTILADRYLPTREFYDLGQKTYGSDPNIAFSGHPSRVDGWYAFEQPILEAINNYLIDVEGAYRAVEVTGASSEAIIDLVTHGSPVVVWTTLDMSYGKKTRGWYLEGTDTLYHAYTNLHCVVVYGYESGVVLTMNPLSGLAKYKASQFFEAYESMGSRGIILESKTD